MKAAKKKAFTTCLMHWNTYANVRKMPWKGEKNPYRIWLSEIILQQTRVEQGTGYYNRFIARYPDVLELAEAPDEEVFKLWEGLGYYSRCRNLIHSARAIRDVYKGVFPDNYNDILGLKGIGPYTAAAISSFAYDLPYAVLDGNVYRVLARYFGIQTPIDSTVGKNLFTGLSAQLMDRSAPAAYNQAIMDLGATICKPAPLCDQCPLQLHCTAFQQGKQSLYPVKEKSIKRKARWFYYVVAEYENKLLIKKRLEKDIWQNLHELVLIESNTKHLPENISNLQEFSPFVNFTILDISREYVQQLTHQTIRGNFVHILLDHAPEVHGFTFKSKEEISTLAFPGFINMYFDESRILK